MISPVREDKKTSLFSGSRYKFPSLLRPDVKQILSELREHCVRR